MEQHLLLPRLLEDHLSCLAKSLLQIAHEKGENGEESSENLRRKIDKQVNIWGMAQLSAVPLLKFSS